MPISWVVKIAPASLNNYIFICICENFVFIVDPTESEPVINCLNDKDLRLDYILITHHHFDHVGGIPKLKEFYPDVQIIAPPREKDKIPYCNRVAEPYFKLSNHEVQTISLPGHTIGHVGFYFPEQDSLFCGDVLFSAGCGRVFEGTYEQMFQSIKKIKQLPSQTKIYCAHEYTLANLKFAKYIDKNNSHIDKALESAALNRSQSIPTIPTTLAKEMLINPFLRTDNDAIKDYLNLNGANELEVFTALRKMKNDFH